MTENFECSAASHSAQRRKCSLLMLVTPPELPVAKFSISALRKFQDFSDVSVVVFANGFEEADETKLKSWTETLPNVRVISNRERIEREKHRFRIGTVDITETGRKELRVGPYETAPEVWERELLMLDAHVVGIIDADFEVLSADFLPVMMDAFSADDRLGFISVDYTPEKRAFDSYSQEWAIMAERYHTWFCLYLREGLEKYADFTFFEAVRGKEKVKFDHSARLQYVLRRDYGYHGAVLDKKWHWSFVHYQAFAQNRTLNGGWLRVYRFFKIGRATGWYSAHHISYLVLPVKVISRAAYKLLWLGRFDRERARYRFETA
jgi:hypothetical protein